jgi:hypothetical protein
MSDPEFDPAATIADALRRQTRETLDFLIVCSDPARNYYVQFPWPGDSHPRSLCCEAVSDKWLESEHRLGEAGAERLRSLGWSDPEGRHDNWFREFELHDEEDFERIAATLVQTLRAVYGYAGGPLEVQVP